VDRIGLDGMTRRTESISDRAALEEALSCNEIRRLSKLFTFPAKDIVISPKVMCPQPLFIYLGLIVIKAHKQKTIHRLNRFSELINHMQIV